MIVKRGAKALVFTLDAQDFFLLVKTDDSDKERIVVRIGLRQNKKDSGI